MHSRCRNSKYLLLALLGLFFIGANQKVEATNNTSAKGEVHVESLHGSVSQNELIDNLERLGIKCIIQEGAADSRLSVERVRLGSSAFYGGVLAGDVIKNLSGLSNNTFQLTIERTGKVYSLNLKALSAQIATNSLNAGTTKDLLQGNIDQKNALATSLPASIQKTLLPGSVDKANKEPEKKLLPYDIELVIDITGSMNWVDGTGNLTKFQWCHEQVRDLAERLAPYHKTLTVTTFNTVYSTTTECTPEKVEQIYATIEPDGNTDLVDPLMSRLDDALKTHKPDGRPVLIVVITDGLPNVPHDPRVVNRALINFTQQLVNPDQIAVTILQIGDTFEGRDFCVDLDDNLVSEGAKYDIVDTKTFAELKQEGLINAMIDAVVEARNDRQLSKQDKHFKRFMKSLPPSSQSVNNTDSELKKRQDERQAIEQQIFGP